jgi:uncharacterized protein (TIGR04141 family)
MKLTVKLSKQNQTITSLLKSGHKLTGPISNWGGITGSEVYYGKAYSGPPSWVDFIASGTKTVLSKLNNSGAIALIFIPTGKRYMVFSFGHTISKLSAIGFERDFGLKVVLNTVDPKKIKSVDSKLVDTVVLSKRTQSSKENTISEFGIDVHKDLLRSVIGKPLNNTFASVVAGSDTLTLNCKVTSSSINKKSQEIIKAYNSNAYKKNYSWVDNVKAVTDKTDLTTLNSKLVLEFNKVLGGSPNTLFQLASPDILDFSTIDHFEIKGFRSKEEIALPDFEKLISELTTHSVSAITLNNLMTYHIDAIDGAVTLDSWPVYDWLIFELQYNGKTYILTEGDWFEVSKQYHTIVDKAFTKIIRQPSEYKKIGTTSEPNEADYLSNYIVSANEFMLDRNLSYVFGGNNPIEICDIYNIHGEFIHVKDGGSSSKLSHLFNQGFVSASAYLSDVNYRNDIASKLKSKTKLAKTITTPPIANNHSIIFRILKSGTTFSLPFFTKVVINDIYTRIKSMGFKFKLEWVEKV